MNPIFSKTIIGCLFLFISNYGIAQQKFEGTAYYISKTDVDMSNFGRPDMSEDQKKRMAERMKSIFEKSYILDFNKTESVFKIEEKLAAPTQQGGGGGRGPGGGFGSIISGAIDGDKYKNSETQELLISNELLGKKFLVKDNLPKLDWKTTGEVKQIGQYMCFKATAIKTWTDFDMSNFRRPPGRDEKPEEPRKEEKTTETLVTAWYTLQIPVSQGPANYWGLPGLILEIHENDTIILCSKIVLNAKEQTTIKKPTKGKKVTLEEYTEIATEKFQEMRENFRGGRRDGRNGGNNRGR